MDQGPTCHFRRALELCFCLPNRRIRSGSKREEEGASKETLWLIVDVVWIGEPVKFPPRDLITGRGETLWVTAPYSRPQPSFFSAVAR